MASSRMQKPSLFKKTCAAFLFVLFTALPVQAEMSDLEEVLALDIEDLSLDQFSLIEAAFVLSGVDDPDSLDVYLEWYRGLLRTLDNYHLDRHNRLDAAAKIFAYLHAVWLLNYKEEATTLVHVVREKRFNCVAGTLLYNLVCQDLGLPTEAFETPSHVYTIFPDFGADIAVENTLPAGFNIMRNLQEYSRYLLQFYPRNEALKIGLDRLYAYENSRGRRINNTELLGLLAYNRAYFAEKAGDYAKAYEYVRLAQKFNRDSRSNVNFEQSLYYRWGKQLVEGQKYTEAFRLFSQAYNRYWENKDFAANCKYTFQLAQREHWLKKEWASFRELTDEILALDLLNDQEIASLKTYMFNWIQFFQQNRSESEYKAVADYWKNLFPEDTFLKSLP